MRRTNSTVSQKGLTKIIEGMTSKLDSVFAYNLKGFCFPTEVKELFSKDQLNHYNFIQIEIFDLYKFIKVELPHTSLNRIKRFVETLQDVCDQLQKLCKSLNLQSIYDLFNNLKLCLLCLSSHLIEIVKGKEQKHKESKQFHHKFAIQLLEKNYITKNYQLSQKKSFKLGGISLYNENYLNHVQKGQAFIRLLDSVEEAHKKKWSEIWEIENNTEEKNNEIFKEIEEMKKQALNINQYRTNDFFYGMNEDEFENNLDNYSTSNFQRAYQMQKNNNIAAISKLLKETEKIHVEEVNRLQQIVQRKQEQINRIIEMRSKYNKKVNMEVQTDPDPQIDELSYELELHKNRIINLENSNIDLTEILKRTKQLIIKHEKNEQHLQDSIDKLTLELRRNKKQMDSAKSKINILKGLACDKWKSNHSLKYKLFTKQPQKQSIQESVSKNLQPEKSQLQKSNYEQSILCELSDKNTYHLIRSQKQIRNPKHKKTKVLFCRSVNNLNIDEVQKEGNEYECKSEKIFYENSILKEHKQLNVKNDKIKETEEGVNDQEKLVHKDEENTNNLSDQMQLQRIKAQKKNLGKNSKNKRNRKKGDRNFKIQALSNEKTKKKSEEPITDATKLRGKEIKKINLQPILKKESRPNISSEHTSVHKMNHKKYIINSRYQKQMGKDSKLERVGIQNAKTTYETTLMTENHSENEGEQKVRPTQKITVNHKYVFAQGKTKVCIDNLPTFEKII